MSAKTAQEHAEALFKRFEPYKDKYILRLESKEEDIATYWYVSAISRSYINRSLITVGWSQSHRNTQGPRVRFMGGMADGYGNKAGKLIDIKTRAQLESWMYVCVESYEVPSTNA